MFENQLLRDGIGMLFSADVLVTSAVVPLTLSAIVLAVVVTLVCSVVAA